MSVKSTRSEPNSKTCKHPIGFLFLFTPVIRSAAFQLAKSVDRASANGHEWRSSFPSSITYKGIKRLEDIYTYIYIFYARNGGFSRERFFKHVQSHWNKWNVTLPYRKWWRIFSVGIRETISLNPEEEDSDELVCTDKLQFYNLQEKCQLVWCTSQKLLLVCSVLRPKCSSALFSTKWNSREPSQLNITLEG